MPREGVIVAGGVKMENYSVLMPLWYKEKIEYLRASLESMLNQTVVPAEIVMVTEHELPKEMGKLLESLQAEHPYTQLNILMNAELEEKGLGTILAYGLRRCQNDIVARMDTDDISMLDRCERELQILSSHPEIAVVGGGIQKFTDDPEVADGYRIPPRDGKKLIHYSKYRCPFNHPTVMYRKKVILEVGNYSKLKECEDYDLWYRVLKNGYQGYNIQEPVLHYRAGDDMLKRRKNKSFYNQSMVLIKRMWHDHYTNWAEALLAAGMQAIRYYFPFSLNRFVYKHIR